MPLMPLSSHYDEPVDGICRRHVLRYASRRQSAPARRAYLPAMSRSMRRDDAHATFIERFTLRYASCAMIARY